MFSGLTQQPNANAGKKIYGLPSRRDQEFTIGWTGNNNLNQFQMRKSKNKQVTGKITTQSIIHGQQTPYSQKKQSYVPPSRDYERMFYENPNMSNQELEKLMYQYQEYRGGPSKQSNKKETRLSEYSEPERRSAVRPKESMKDIIYNGVGAGQDISNRVGSRVQFKIQSAYHLTQKHKITITIEEKILIKPYYYPYKQYNMAINKTSSPYQCHFFLICQQPPIIYNHQTTCPNKDRSPSSPILQGSTMLQSQITNILSQYMITNILSQYMQIQYYIFFKFMIKSFSSLSPFIDIQKKSICFSQFDIL